MPEGKKRRALDFFGTLYFGHISGAPNPAQLLHYNGTCTRHQYNTRQCSQIQVQDHEYGNPNVVLLYSLFGLSQILIAFHVLSYLIIKHIGKHLITLLKRSILKTSYCHAVQYSAVQCSKVK